MHISQSMNGLRNTFQTQVTSYKNATYCQTTSLCNITRYSVQTTVTQLQHIFKLALEYPGTLFHHQLHPYAFLESITDHIIFFLFTDIHQT